MKTFRQLIMLLWGCSLATASLGQDFRNGDLEGEVQHGVVSVLPEYWQNVPSSDPVCLASGPPRDSPDLTAINGPSFSLGVFGLPFHGFSFVSGGYSVRWDTVLGDSIYFQEGIMQRLSGLDIGCSYTISFHQTVVVQKELDDPQGRWAVYLDDSLIGKTGLSNSNNHYSSPNLRWDAREISFSASQSSHTIKFLPFTPNPQVITPGVRMGIDYIQLNKVFEIIAYDFIGDSLCLEDKPYLYASIANSSYRWQDGSTDSILMIKDTGLYYVEAINACGRYYDTLQVRILNDCRCDVYMPNGFTPNGDGLNDNIHPATTCDLAYFELSIYNRWGSRVFQAFAPDVGWDGSVQGKPAPSGTYAYTIHYRHGRDYTKRGVINLLR